MFILFSFPSFHENIQQIIVNCRIFKIANANIDHDQDRHQIKEYQKKMKKKKKRNEILKVSKNVESCNL